MCHDPDLLAAHLLADGYCVIRDAIPPPDIAALDRDLSPRFADTPFCEGDFYGPRTKRFGALLLRTPHARSLIMHRLVLRIVDTVLGVFCDRFTLNLTQAVEIHPGACAQFPHRDQDIWRRPRGYGEWQVNVIWPLVPFSEANGATIVWPGSHDPRAPEEPKRAGRAIEMEPGSALLFLGSTLHSGGANTTQAARRAVIVGYCLGWLRTFENQYLVYPPEVARMFDPELAALVGYTQHLPNLGNVEGQCPSILLRDGNIDNLAAVDALPPDHAAVLRRYAASQASAQIGFFGG